MGTFFSVLFIFIVIAYGMKTLVDKMPKRGKQPKPTQDVETAPEKQNDLNEAMSHCFSSPRDLVTAPKELLVLIKALSNEGYFGKVKKTDEEITFVDSPVLAGMIEQLGTKCDLMWTVPSHRLRIREMMSNAPESMKAKYKWLLLTPTHAVGFSSNITREAST